MVNPEASIDVLWLPYELTKILKYQGAGTVRQVMDIPAYLTYEEVYHLSKEQADTLRDKVRLYLKNEGGISNMTDMGVVSRQTVKIIENCEEVPLEYPSDKDTESDKAYQAGYKSGWAAAVQVIKKSLEAIDSAVMEGMEG